MTTRRVEYMRLDEITGADKNPKLHDDAGISRSIGHHGLGELPLLDDRTEKLVAGHGRLAQLVRMHGEGDSAPDGISVDDDGMWRMPVVRGWSSRSDADAAAYLVGSNKLTETGGVDEILLTEVLDDLAGDNLLEVTGYDSGDLEALLALYSPAETGGGSGGGFDDDDEDLDSLGAGGFGSGQGTLDETDRAAWPIIRAQVPPDVHERFMSIDGENDAQRVGVLLDRAGIL